MSEHSYFIFDPEVPGDAFEQSELASIAEWRQGDVGNEALKMWSEYSFIRTTSSNTDAKDGLIKVFPKSHGSSLALRAASQPLYHVSDNPSSAANLETVGCFVTLPERMSARQQQWLSLIEPPTDGRKVLLTIGEYQLLKHLRVVSSANPLQPVNFVRLDVEPLAQKIRSNISLPSIQLASLKPSATKALLTEYAWWFESLNNGASSNNDSYALHSLMHVALTLRAERLSQLRAIIYSYYYGNEKEFIEQPYNIKGDWIEKNPNEDPESLFLKVFATDGWFNCAYSEQQLPLSLLALACLGCWSVDSLHEDPLYLLNTTIKLFEYAHQSSDELANQLHSIIYQPENPFDLYSSNITFNELMPVFAAICRHEPSKAKHLALIFDDEAKESFIQKFIDGSDDQEERTAELIKNLLKAD